MKRMLIAAGVFAALGAALFAPVLFCGKTLIAADVLAASPVWRDAPGPVPNPGLTDTVEYYYPSEKIYSESVRRGELPLVNPWIFNGTPVPHGIHIWNSIWPPKLLFLLLFDPVRSYDLFAIFHWWLAAMAFFAFARELGRSDAGAFGGALAYALSGRAMLWLHGHYLMATLAYAPLVFLAARRRTLLGAVPLCGLFLTNPHGAIAVTVAVLVFDRRAWKTALCGALLAGAALLPLAVTVLGGVRDPVGETSYFYRDGWRSWLLLGELVAPGKCLGSMAANEYNVYVGLVPLALAVFGARRERYFPWLAGIALAAATLWPLPLLLAPLSFSLPTRWLFLFTLGACVCFARGLDALPPRRWLQAVIILLLLVDLVPRFVRHNATHDPALLHERPPAVEVIKGGRTGWVLRDHPDLGRPVTPPLSLFGIPSVQGYDVMVPKAQQRELGGAGEVGGGRTIRLTDPDSPVLEGLGMRYLISDEPLELRRFRLVHTGSVYVYENPAAPEPAPRPAEPLPFRLGVAVTLAGAALAVLLAFLDRRRGVAI